MDAHIIQKGKNGRIVKSFYRLGDFSGNKESTLSHLKSQGFNDSDAEAYLNALPRNVETV